MEEQRPTRVVAVPATYGATDAPMLLTADSGRPERLVRYRSNIETEYLGMIATTDYTYVLVRKWMPGWDHWAESKFRVTLDQEIGGSAVVPVDEGPKPRRRIETLLLTTGCIAVNQDPKEWLDVRDPAGVIRRLPLVSGGASRSPKVNECKDPPPAPELTLDRAASAATRMAGRQNARYINVGFRCAKTLWPLPAAPKKRRRRPRSKDATAAAVAVARLTIYENSRMAFCGIAGSRLRIFVRPVPC